MDKYKIALVDDCKDTLSLFHSILSSHFDVTCYSSEKQLFSDNVSKFNGILVDLHMPEVNKGISVIESLKRIAPPRTAIFLLTNDMSIDAKVAGLNLEISDYLIKKMDPTEMYLRIKNSIKLKDSTNTILDKGNLQVDLSNLTASINSIRINLTLTEFKILHYILKNNIGKEVQVDEEHIKSNVFQNAITSDNNLKVHLTNLRNKLTDWEYTITKKRGKGYVLKQNITA